MLYLGMCQQPDNYDLFKDRRPASLGVLCIELQWNGKGGMGTGGGGGSPSMG